MKTKLKELIDNAEPFATGKYNVFLLITSGEAYDGFFGKNGFDNIIILARNDKYDEPWDEVEKWWRLDWGSTDDFTLLVRDYTSRMAFDIPSELGCVRFHIDDPITINTCPASSLIADNGYYKI